MTCVLVDNYSPFYILEPPPYVSDVNFLQDDVRSMADNLSEIISCFSSLCKNLEHPLDVSDVLPRG
jgi:hypothetical protein